MTVFTIVIPGRDRYHSPCVSSSIAAQGGPSLATLSSTLEIKQKQINQLNCIKTMKNVFALALAGIAFNVSAGNVNATFDNDFGTLANPTNDVWN